MKKIMFYDIDENMCNAWDKYFNNDIEVSIENIPFEKVSAKYVVTAGNSYGVMSGGIDLAVRDYFGIIIQDIIQANILFNSEEKKLEVGQCLIVPTPDESKQNIVYAPTMEVPGRIDKINVYKATKAVLESCYNKDGVLAICGLGTGVGGVSYEDSAEMCYEAYKEHVRKIRGF